MHKTHGHLEGNPTEGIAKITVELELECDCGATLAISNKEHKQKNCENCGCLWKVRLE